MESIVKDVTSYLKEIDPILSKHIDKIGEFKLLSINRSTYSHLIGIIIGQLISLQSARLIRRKLYTFIGTDNFTPNDILKMTSENFRLCGVDKNKELIIRNVTNYIVNNKLKLDKKSEILSLTKVKGVKKWTVDSTLLMTLIDFDIVLVGDYYIKQNIKKIYSMKKIPSEEDIVNLSKKWSPYSSFAMWYLWQK
jgi:DNA-3-methyladenine glycosylase II